MKHLKQSKFLLVGVILWLIFWLIFFPTNFVYAAPDLDIVGTLKMVGCVFAGAFVGGFVGGVTGTGPILGVPAGLAVGAACAVGTGAAFDLLSDAAKLLFDVVINPLAEALVWLASWLVIAAGKMLDWVLGAEFNEPRNIVNNNFVNTGWTLLRDLANMAFILVLIIIAFATITRREQYGVKSLLPKLILVAILINFSKVIAGAIIDVSQILMMFFLDSFPESDIGLALVNSMNLGEIGSAHWSDLKLGGISGAALTFTGYIVTFFLYIGAAFALALFAVLLIIRVVALWLLIIFSPLAFIAAILPDSQSIFRNWWHRLIKWSFFGVTAGFFVWLALILGRELGTAGFGEQVTVEINTIDGLVASIMRYAALLALLFIGMGIARSSTEAAGAWVSGKFEGAARRTMGIVARPVPAAMRVARERAAREARERTYLRAGRAGRALLEGPLRRIPGMPAIGRQLVRYQESVRDEINKRIAELGRMKPENVRAMYDQYGRSGRVAASEVLMGQGYHSLLSEEQVKEANDLRNIYQFGRKDQLIKSRPSLLAKRENKTVAEVLDTYDRRDWTGVVEEEFDKMAKDIGIPRGEAIKKISTAAAANILRAEHAVNGFNRLLNSMGDTGKIVLQNIEKVNPDLNDYIKFNMAKAAGIVIKP